MQTLVHTAAITITTSWRLQSSERGWCWVQDPSPSDMASKLPWTLPVHLKHSLTKQGWPNPVWQYFRQTTSTPIWNLPHSTALVTQADKSLLFSLVVLGAISLFPWKVISIAALTSPSTLKRKQTFKFQLLKVPINWREPWGRSIHNLQTEHSSQAQKNCH